MNTNMAPQEFQDLLDASRSRSLTAPELAQLEDIFSRLPHLRSQWDQEKYLNHLLHKASLDQPSASIEDAIMDVIHNQHSENFPVSAHQSLSCRFSQFVSRVRHGLTSRPALRFASVALPTIVFVVALAQMPSSSNSDNPIALENFSTISSIKSAGPVPEILNPDVLQDFQAIVYATEVESMVDKDLIVAMQSLK